MLIPRSPVRLVTRFLPLYLVVALTALFTSTAGAAPGDILFSDNFDDGNLGPWTRSNILRAGVSNANGFGAAGSWGAYTRFGAVTVTSPAINAFVPAARLSLWVRRGADSFSEDTDSGEDLVLEYLRDDNSWGVLKIYLGGGSNGEVYDSSILLPPDALHNALAIRLRQTNGSGSGYDYWHFDNVVVTETTPPEPLAVGSCDDFEAGLSGNWSVSALSGFAGVSNATFSSPENSMYLNGGVVTVQSNVVDTSDSSFGDLAVWVRRGSDSFSELPDGGENLIVEYFNDNSTWVPLETFTGSGAAGQIFSRNYDLPAAGRHANFRLRFRQSNGSGANYDFWHVDDVCFDLSTDPLLHVAKFAEVVADPINGSSDPRAIPGATMKYRIVVTNQGPGSTDPNSLVITEIIPPETTLYVATMSGDPIVFVDGSVASGFSFDFTSDVAFSNQPGGGGPYNYLPVPDAAGYDSSVTGFSITPGGTFNAAIGGNFPQFTIELQVRIN
ncbi:MAG TPA: hypothetical protein PKK10_16560 [Woeseiaceae bacterium]|nr:hypothetical protein [Woeseiaceae bacterium]